MKRITLLAFALLLALAIKAQQNLSYGYDAAGNRTSRTILLAGFAKSTMVTDSEFFEERLADMQVRIYPNPVEYELTISIDGYEPSMKGEFSLITLTGSTLVSGLISGESTFLDMSERSKGTYVLNIQLNGQSTSWKVIKQ